MIETERLILRPFRESDAADVLEYLRRPSVNCFASMRLDSPEAAVAEMRRRMGETEYFAITLRENGKVIGEIEASPENDPHDAGAAGDTFSPCWMLNEAFQGRGYAFEAAHAFFEYLFREKGARRIYAYTEENNYPSRRLCEKLGMRREGLFREFVSFVNEPDGTPHYENTMQYAILKKEWVAEKVKRVTRFEGILDRANETARQLEEALSVWREIRGDLKVLEAYYTGPEWKEDFCADEAGLLPAELKRGVLSEDGIDHVLERFRELSAMLNDE